MYTKICDLQFRHNYERMTSQVTEHTYSSPSLLGISLASLLFIFLP